MKATIDGKGCISCGLCASTCPELIKALTSILPAGGSISINFRWICFAQQAVGGHARLMLLFLPV